MNGDFEYVVRAGGRQRIWIERRLAGATDLISVLRDPDALLEQPRCEIIKDQRKIKIGRVSVMLDGRQEMIYVKRYNAFSWRYRIGSLFLRSECLTALQGAAMLARANIAAARPVAAVESRRWGALEKSFFISQEIAGGKTADRYWLEELVTVPGREGRRRRRNFLHGLASLFRSLHEQNIYHRDLKDANIIVVPRGDASESFFLLDLEGIRRCRLLSVRRRTKNLVQINRTLGNYLRRAEKLRALTSYVGPSSADRRALRSWAARVLARSERVNRRKIGSAATPA